MDKLTLRLTLTVTYDNPNNEAEYLKDNLRLIADHAYATGTITEATNAEIDTWRVQVETVIGE